jgi:hypothetical protein
VMIAAAILPSSPMKVSDNVAFPLKMHGVTGRERARRVSEVLELVEMDTYTERFPHELSGGQQQRVPLARALAFPPSILLLDEPFSNLEAKLRERARDWLREQQRRIGVTTVFVTHDQDEALAMSDRIRSRSRRLSGGCGSGRRPRGRPSRDAARRGPAPRRRHSDHAGPRRDRRGCGMTVMTVLSPAEALHAATAGGAAAPEPHRRRDDRAGRRADLAGWPRRRTCTSRTGPGCPWSATSSRPGSGTRSGTCRCRSGRRHPA